MFNVFSISLSKAAQKVYYLSGCHHSPIREGRSAQSAVTSLYYRLLHLDLLGRDGLDNLIESTVTTFFPWKTFCFVHREFFFLWIHLQDQNSI